MRHIRHAQAKFHNIDERIFCLRGFEAYFSPRAVQQKLLRKVAAAQTVMELQFQLRRQGRDDLRKMRLEYYRVTAPARKLALKRAALDAAEVKLADNLEAHFDDDDASILQNKMDRLLAIKSARVQPILRSPTSGPLRLRKTVPNTA